MANHHLIQVSYWRNKERNVLFNDALNIFYLRLYSGHMVKDHSDCERGNPLHGILLSINSKASFICTIPQTISYTSSFVTLVVEHWLEMRNSSVDPPWGIDPTTHRTMSGRSPTKKWFFKCTVHTRFFDLSEVSWNMYLKNETNFKQTA